MSTLTRHALILAAKALCLSLVCLALASCADQEGDEPVLIIGDEPVLIIEGEGAGDASLAPRWVHRYVPKGLLAYDPDLDRWRPESEVPRVPESSTSMVIWEVSEYPPGTEPTPAQQRAADDLVERCYAAAVRNGWDRIEKGLADGYRPVDRHHYRNDEYMLDDRVLDPDHPEVLMYYATPPSGSETEGRHQLAGFMFYARDLEARAPQIGGPLTIWHYHAWRRPQCVVDGLVVDWSVDGECERGTPTYFSGEMMHVWLVDRPQGRFATPMFLPNKLLLPLLEQRFEERGF